MIDMRRVFAYIAGLSLVGMVLLGSPVQAAGENTYRGATLPPWAKSLGEGRFRSPWAWDQTQKWLDRNYARWEYPRIRIVNKPGIKAIHLVHKKNRGWSGLNVYELRDGEVRIFVLPAKK